MKQTTSTVNRRRFLTSSGAAVAGTAALSGLARTAHAAEDNTIRLALIGCGGRGAGAVADALSVPNEGPVQLYATADLLESKMETAVKTLGRKFPGKVDVPKERQFAGFDAYKQAIDLLRPGDVAMCTTRAYIRPVHVEYAVKKGVNVFMEKPFSPDPAGLHRLLAVAEEADKKNVKIAAGLQCRHSPARQALIERVRDGLLGEIQLIRANRLGGRRWLSNQLERSNEVLSQLQFGKIHLFWVGSGHMVDNLIHQIDECCWIKDAWPVSVIGMGGRNPRSQDHGQNLDVYSMEYTFADGAKAFCGFRRQSNTRYDFATYLHGTKTAAQFSGKVHKATVHQFKDQRIDLDNIAWTPTDDAYRPWQYEWNDLIHSIRNDRPHNECRRAVYADMASLMGRAACHTGQEITRDDIMTSDFQFCNDLENFNANTPAPAQADADGWFETPIPGKWKEI
jgi:predicted dehydrogenase